MISVFPFEIQHSMVLKLGYDWANHILILVPTSQTKLINQRLTIKSFFHQSMWLAKKKWQGSHPNPTNRWTCMVKGTLHMELN